ncbi:hypothetical protein JTE88_01540 [Arcanobacterium phocisimile]|uniref:Uncharacterized protein n=1 Tax=Arcanobacterium phocisimile TaxID=1302235 RepID=A0ABX7IHD2_9ACTO|nr:hypothetical protein [Arcanobacterium phocisimile]QRV02467.1 hypothetical protein JTE88_01540 [Arcanobacterium phocisimile]
MVWETLIEGIAAHIRNNERQELFEEIDEITDAENASVSFADRIRGARGRYITITVSECNVTGVVIESGKDWLMLSSQEQIDLVKLDAISVARGLRQAAFESSRYVPTMSSVLRRLIGHTVLVNRYADAVRAELLSVGKDYVVVEPKAELISLYGYQTAHYDEQTHRELYIPFTHLATVSSATLG